PRSSAETNTARGRHHYLKRPGNFPLPASISIDGVTLEVKRDGQYVVLPNSRHPNGHVYAEVEPWPETLDALPELSPQTVSQFVVHALLHGPTASSQTPAAPLPDAV